MKREPDYEHMSVFEQIRAGLNDSITHTRTRLTLKTTTLLGLEACPLLLGADVSLRPVEAIPFLETRHVAAGVTSTRLGKSLCHRK